ncbi:UDP-glucose 4-epimerase-like [Oscarella lobularis]|uniref:UDP-glucose 4-epimerase-like n=1 Tax=Oscarella lobularis TaxID=121494 RepID=UPI003313F1F5
METKFVLITGGAGYVGSHACLELLQTGDYVPVVIDNMANATYANEDSGIMPESLRRVCDLTNKQLKFHEVDMTDKSSLAAIFKKYKFHCVIHFAALKAVGESITIPLTYYRVNVGGTLNLLEVMKEHGVRNLIFSSSATVYGSPQKLPIDESHPTGIGCTNPYGRTKYFIEEMMKDLAQAEKDQQWNIILLRYFNPIGAHSSGHIGEDPKGIPNNLMPYVAQVAVGKRAELSIYGNDYDTHDGTGVRDYLHVVDLAIGHVAALKKVEENCGLKIYNLGTGQGYSVLDMVKAFQKASRKEIRYKIVERRAGDVAVVYADSSLAEKELGWKATRGLDKMCEDSWKWQSMNPNGYGSR